MIRGAHTETCCGSCEKASEDDEIGCRGGVIAWVDEGEEKVGDCDEEDGADEVGVDVYCFVVDVEEGVEGGEVGVGGVAVAGLDVVVVAAPGFEVVPVEVEGGGEGGFGGGGGLGEG